MKKVYIIALVSALLCGVLFFAFLKGYDSDRDEEVVPDVEVVIAIDEIAENTQITQEMVQTIKISADAANGSAMQNIDDVVGKFTNEKIYAQEQIIEQKLYDKDSGEGNSLSLNLEKGMRAMTISASTVSGVGGYIASGDYVDILLANGDKEPEEVVSAVKVLKVGNRLYNETGEIYSDITFEISVDDCKKIYAAQQKGDIRLLLREKTDH